MKTENAIKTQEFLEGLQELTDRTGVAIVSCGCCGSPWTEMVEDGWRYTWRVLNDGTVDMIKRGEE